MREDVSIIVLAGLIVLTGPDGTNIDVNPRKIVALRDPGDNLHPGVRCQISTSDGKFIGVAEPCSTVLSKYNGDEKY